MLMNMDVRCEEGGESELDNMWIMGLTELQRLDEKKSIIKN